MEKLIKALKSSPISDYSINIVHKESVELFYVLNKLETNRATNTDEVEVSIFIDKDGKRGRASFTYFPYMDEEELKEEIAKKIYAASFALNQYYDIPSKSDVTLDKIESNLKDYTLMEAAHKVVNALLRAKQYEESVFSATEIFINKIVTHIINSRGVDLSFTNYQGFVEFIPSWEEDGEEVETYNNIRFSTLDEDYLVKQFDECINLTRDRFNAIPLKLNEPVKVIIEGEDVPNYFDFFVDDLSYRAKYQHMNRFELNQSTQGDNITGDKLNISLLPSYKGCADSKLFDADGVVLKPVELIKDGIALANHGSFRMGYYLGVKDPTGLLPIIKVEAGKKSFEEMRKEPYVRCVKFSSFQLEENSGFFGGEVRLGYYFDGEKEIPVTGFSIAGNIHEAKSSVIFSKDTEILAGYVGPKYLEIKGMGIN